MTHVWNGCDAPTVADLSEEAYRQSQRIARLESLIERQMDLRAAALTIEACALLGVTRAEWEALGQ